MCVNCKKRTNMMPNFTPLLTYNNVHIHTYNYSPKSAWLHGLHFWLSRLLMLWTLETVAPYGATIGWIFFWRSHINFMKVFRRIFHEKYISKVLAAFEFWWGQAYVVGLIYSSPPLDIRIRLTNLEKYCDSSCLDTFRRSCAYL